MTGSGDCDPDELDAHCFFTIDQLARALSRDTRFVLSFEGEPVVFAVVEPGASGGGRGGA